MSDNESAPAATRRLIISHIDLLRLAVFEDQVLTVVEWSEPTPLPFSPSSVRGIVCIEGRMFTVLDIGGLLGANAGAPRALIVALRGEEQFALAVDAAGPPVEMESPEVQAAGESASRLILGILSQNGEQVQMLDTKELFAGVIQGRERRRRRF